jgi:hypothetical protein
METIPAPLIEWENNSKRITAMVTTGTIEKTKLCGLSP